MILLILAVLVLLAAAGAGLLGIGVLSDDRRRDRSGMLGLLSAPVALVVGALLLAVLMAGLGGLRSGEEHSPDTTTPPPTVAPTRPDPESAQPLPSSRVEVGGETLPVVTIEPDDDDQFSPYRLVSGLTPGSAVRVQADGFEWHERGRVEQCVFEIGHQTACAETFPVQFDEDGRADFQLAVRGDFAPGGCRLGQPTCLLRLTGNDSGRRGTAQTVLVDSLAPGHVTVEPARGLADGQAVEVSVTGFPGATTAAVVLCAPPDTYDARRCAAPDETSRLAIDASGSGRTSLVVTAGRLGSDAKVCGPRRPCGVTVLVGPGFVAAVPPVPVAFSAGPGVAYDGRRMLFGVAGALVLAGLAIAIAVRTDWTKPTEAATPALDRADLRTDENLDELFGTDEEIDQRDPIPW